MKKHLLGTSAIVAASLGMASAAMAQAPAGPQPVQLTINGNVASYVGFVDQDNVGSNNIGTNPLNSTCINCARPNHFDMFSDNRILFNLRGNLGDGVFVGGQMDVGGTNSGAANPSHVRANYAFIDAPWGQIRGGATGQLARSMVGANYSTSNAIVRGDTRNNDVFGRTGLVSGAVLHNLLINPTGSGGTQSTIDGENGDMNDNLSTKIYYLAPRLFGFQFGIGWTPELSKDVTGNGEVIVKEGQKATYRNGVSVGLNYSENFAGVDVAAGVGYTRYLDAPRKSALGLIGAGATCFTNSPAAGCVGTAVPDPEQFQAGVQLAYAGFKIGGGWGKISNSRAQQTAFNEFTGQQVFRVSTINSSLINLKGEAWSAGVSYGFGPAAVSLNYTNGKNNDCPVHTGFASTACTGDDKFSAVGVGGSYIIGPGVQLSLGGFYGRYRGNNYNNGALFVPAFFGTGTTATTTATNASQNNEGGGVITGLLIRF